MLRKWLLMGICVLLVLFLASCTRNTPSDVLNSSSSLVEVSSWTNAAQSDSDVSVPESVSSEEESHVSAALPSSETSGPAQSLSSSSQLVVSSTATTSVEGVLPPSENEPIVSVPSHVQSVSSAASVLSEAEKQITVTLAIYGVGGELMVDAGSIRVSEGSTVFTVLRDYAKESGLEFTYSGGAKSAYVAGIGGLYEFDHGSQSGWLYRVNGDFSSASVSCGSYSVCDGDRIEWLYTIDRGADVGAPR